jgi:hypothetical protein
MILVNYVKFLLWYSFCLTQYIRYIPYDNVGVINYLKYFRVLLMCALKYSKKAIDSIVPM